MNAKIFLDTFTDVLDSVREPLVILDANLKIVKATLAFYRTFCTKQENRPSEFLVGWVEERNPTPISCWVSLRSTQPTLWPML